MHKNTISNSFSPSFNFLKKPEQKVLEIHFPRDLFNRVSSFAKQNAMTRFIEELKANPDKLKRIGFSDLMFSFMKTVDTLASLGDIEIYFQITSLNSLVVKGEASDNNVYLEMFFDEISGSLDEVVINIFAGRMPQFNDAGSLDEMLSKLKDFFDYQESDYQTYPNPQADYDISGGTLAAADF